MSTVLVKDDFMFCPHCLAHQNGLCVQDFASPSLCVPCRDECLYCEGEITTTKLSGGDYLVEKSHG